MKSKQAQPGKPGEWNGRPMRWRQYVRSIKRIDPGATARLAEAELKLKTKHARFVASAIWARNLVIAAGALALLWWRCSVG